MTDFIYIDGVEYRPDEDLVEKIKEYFNKKTANPFDKVALGEDYFSSETMALLIRSSIVNLFLTKLDTKMGTIAQIIPIWFHARRKKIYLEECGASP